MDKDFGTLRGLISDPSQSEEWNEVFWDLLKRVSTEREKEYRDVWIPYCSEHKQTLKSLKKTVLSLGELEEWVKLAPFALFSLDLSGKEIGDEDCKALVKSPFLTHLYSLDLSENELYDDCCEELVKSPSLGNLQHLCLRGNSLGPLGCRILSKSPYLNNLQTLDLGCCEIDEQSFVDLANSPHMSNLRSLFLNGNPVRGLNGDNYGFDDPVEALANSPYLDNLQILDLSRNGINNEDCKKLANASSLSKLHTLSLRENDIGNEGCRELANSPSFNGLQVLELEDNFDIEAEGYLAIACSRHLSEEIRREYLESVEEEELFDRAREYGIEVTEENKQKERLAELIWQVVEQKVKS
ncbi:MAG TPA: hypothetical protein DCE42_16260 [Myxococcales bacterium]|nr:hypothetical protein [Deltaproteobacteria bacterium]HAA56319.1 hypothetical protein [Myxococcales bacterium]|tara:strand:+ start:3957 stop:5021 length:1065 start_codon:yes stop_codon:yes gene_type:complete